ncbi:hypothetical protein COHA_009128 [Chlorella ohadii]|uniref:Uncharacterized protein n=1 Tax=Chlorella ohadii TaxID=2649997 RepID=A0AAD5H2K4_9CHLO|nr:hypothetical protein COHA_009128 [Chlorella ohadii]
MAHAGHPPALPGAEGIHVVRDAHVAALQRYWHAAEAAAAVGMVPPEEQELLTRVMQPSGSRIERVRTITGVLERLREMEAGPEPHSRTLGLISALVVHELNMLVDAMDYEELYAAFGGELTHEVT